MSDLTAKFAATEDLMSSIGDEAHSQRESILSSMSDMQTEIADVGAQIAQLRNLLLSGIGQNDPCATCPPPSLITPVTSPTSQPVNADKCKRVQAFLNAVSQISGVLGAVSNNAIVWTPSIVTSGISEVLTSLVTTGSVPLPSFGESVNIAGDTINYALANIGRNDNLQSQFDSISAGMIQPMYDAGNPAAEQAQYTSLIDASSLPNDEKLLFKALGFNALFSYFFDPTSHPDLTPYSSTPCAFPACMTFTTAEMIHTTVTSGDAWIPDWTKYGITPVTLPGGTDVIWVCVQANGATWDNTGFTHVYHQRQDDPSGFSFAETGVFASIGVSNWITIVNDTGPFSLTTCGILPAGSC